MLMEGHAVLVANAGVVGEEDLKADWRQVFAGLCTITLGAIGAGAVDMGVAGEFAAAVAVASVGLKGGLGCADRKS